MEIKIIDKDEFFKDIDFFHKNLGYVFNFHPKHQKMFDGVLNGFSKFFNQPENCFLVMACDNDKIYSLATFEKYENSWLIDSMSTRQEFQRQGLATKVLKAGMNHIKGDFCLHVKKDNLPALKLYKKLGFCVDIKHPYQFEESFFMTKIEKKLEK